MSEHAFELRRARQSLYQFLGHFPFPKPPSNAKQSMTGGTAQSLERACTLAAMAKEEDSNADADRIPVLPEPPHILEARERWQHRGDGRPEFAETPDTGQVSVWDFPRPPAVLPCVQRLAVYQGDKLVAETRRGVRVLETASAPTYYFPPEDVVADLDYGDMNSVCEWKGVAQTCSLGEASDIGWRYVRMFPAFLDLYLWVSFYPGRLRCLVDDEEARPQPGGFYGGWVTDEIVGPFKGEPGTLGW